MITISVPVIPAPAIKKPPTAWPVTDAESHVPWLQVVAFCKLFLGTICPIIALNTGPVKDLIMPVQKITIYMQIAIQ